MPQATPEMDVQALDTQALDILKDNFVVDNRGVISPKVKGYHPTKRESDAINYLFHEWDYEFHPFIGETNATED